jgi:hypothetical protein
MLHIRLQLYSLHMCASVIWLQDSGCPEAWELATLRAIPVRPTFFEILPVAAKIAQLGRVRAHVCPICCS